MQTIKRSRAPPRACGSAFQLSEQAAFWKTLCVNSTAHAPELQKGAPTTLACYNLSLRLNVRLRILISGVIGLAAGLFCWFLLTHFHQGAADFSWAIRAARSMLARQNPYDTPLAQYPLTAAFFALPFVWLPPELAAALFYGGSSALLAFGLTRHGYHRLLVFLAYPYWAGLITAQWAPLIMASAFFPLLLPATMVKPQIGLPVFLTRLSRRGFVACAALGLITLAVTPRWPWLWLGQLGYYEHFVPLLVAPGFLLALALLRYRDKDAWLLLLAAAMPQRWFFDTLILWLIPKERREIVWTAGISWCAGVWRWYHAPHSPADVGHWTVVFIYLPMLGVLLARSLFPPDSAAVEETRRPSMNN